MLYPNLGALKTTRLLTSVFPGYVHKMTAEDGSFYHTKNLTTDHYPMLSTRQKRGTVRAMTAPGGLIEKDALAFVDNGTLYFNGLATNLTGLSSGEKQLVSMGAYICIFPDKKYYNTLDGNDYGSMEASYSNRAGTTVRYSLCRSDGTDYDSVQVGAEEPESTSVEVWISTAGGTAVAMSYSASSGGWVELGTVYTKITFTTQGTIPSLFSEGDGVTISGASVDVVNGEKTLRAVGGSGETGNEVRDFVVVVGLIEQNSQSSDSVSITRTVPDMDYVCEAQNRLWGCYYGPGAAENLNEIYCCALGDFKNWRQYNGLSTDSWTASVGSDGQWTGAVNYLGYPTFFKENVIHQVIISSVGAHQLQETVCRGVQKGSAKSLVVVNETLFYKSRYDIASWQGGFPQSVSDALGEAKYYNAAAGAFGGKYHISMQDEAGDWHLFVYDIGKGLWIRHDALHAMQFAKVDDELYAIDADSSTLVAINGTVGTLEGDLQWEAESPLQMAVPYAGPSTFKYRWSQYQNKKYLSRFNIRLRMEEGATATVYLEYESSGTWVESGSVVQTGTGTVTLPIRPRRCDHLRMKITGSGDVQILSVARILEVGSDV